MQYPMQFIFSCSVIALTAFEASKKVSEKTSHYNPLYIYGGVGMGKTHLLNSIGLSLKDTQKVMFISAERFMYQFV